MKVTGFLCPSAAEKLLIQSGHPTVTLESRPGLLEEALPIDRPGGGAGFAQ